LAGEHAVDRANTSDDDAPGAEFVRLLTSHQRDIYLYVRSLVLDPNEVEDIVQNTNLVLWEKRDQFDKSREFRPWAFQIARYKVLEHRAQRKRKCVCFSDALADELALKVPQYARAGSDLINDLRRCVAQLAARDRELLNQRYSLLANCECIAKAVGRPVNWVYKALNRIRQELVDCMAQHISAWRERTGQ
jgi:RNA polymerase sigma-70 factor, ECF subfamily